MAADLDAAKIQAAFISFRAMGGPAKRPYHHGDLRRALVREAVRAIAEEGPGALSLRELARRVGVSHAAPAHHFGDKAGLMTAVAAEGFRLLAGELRDAYERTGDLVEVGVAYVRFAVRQQAYFDVMFRLDLSRPDDPELLEARRHADEWARELLSAHVARLDGDGADEELLSAGIAAWSLVHGLATLFVSGHLPGPLGDDPERIARSVAAHLFGRA